MSVRFTRPEPESLWPSFQPDEVTSSASPGFLITSFCTGFAIQISPLGLEDFPALLKVIRAAVCPDNGVVLDVGKAGLRDREVNAMLGHPGAAH